MVILTSFAFLNRDLGLERKISFMLQDWDVIQTPVVEKQVQVSICLISSSELVCLIQV